MKKQFFFYSVLIILMIQNVSFAQFQKVLTVNNICQDKFKIYTYPMLFPEYLVLEISEELKEPTAIIYNLQGQEIRKEPLPRSKTFIDIRSFEKGMYLVRLSTPAMDQTKKFIKN